MTVSERREITQLLQLWNDGEEEALEELMPRVYGELRRLARSYLRRERVGHTLETSALVHEAYVRLIDQSQVSWQGRSHFYGIAAQAMRRILVDHARSLTSQKRGGGAPRAPLDEALHLATEQPKDLLALDRALEGLAKVDPDKVRLIELHFFVGLSHSEIAKVMETSLSTIERRWRLARAWLYRCLAED